MQFAPNGLAARVLVDEQRIDSPVSDSWLVSEQQQHVYQFNADIPSIHATSGAVSWMKPSKNPTEAGLLI